MSASKGVLFGTGGVPKSSALPSTLSGIQRIAQVGLDCLEVEFVKGINLGADSAQKVGEIAKALNVRLSVHAPYYVNLNSVEEGKRLASLDRLLSSARMARTCGAESVIFHAGYYGRMTPEQAYENIKKGLSDVVSILKQERNPVVLRPETMGKRSQFGSLEEILFLCREMEAILPCVDFSHIHAREGKANSYAEFVRILKKIEKKLGSESMKKMHIHISGAEYDDKGEMKHINLTDSDFLFDDWIQALKDCGVEGMVICESPNREQDAMMLKSLFHSKK
jgi:deoxyribonuclease-4